MRVLVTGGAGYIGSHACKALALAGHAPITFDNLSRGHRDAVRWGPLFVGDLLEPAALDAAVRTYRPHVIVHFAALAYVGESMRCPSEYYRNNVVGTLHLLESMRRHSVRHIVFSSSCATYGVPKSLPIRETAHPRPINPYGAAKLAAERMILDYAQAYGLTATILRYFNAAGADPDGELGERHEPETHAVALAINAALGVGPAFTIYGGDFPTRDGTAERDYVHVSDLADAHVTAAERLFEGRPGGVYNLGTGRGTTVKELLAIVERVTRREAPVVWADRRPGDPPALYADAARAARELHWTPKFTDLARTVSTAVAWVRGAGASADSAARRLVTPA